MTRLTARWVNRMLEALVLGGLAVDAYVHLHLAGGYSGIRSSTLSQADLFRLEGSAALIAGGLLLVWPRVWTAALAFVVAVSGALAVLVYTYSDPGRLGPLPDMYEPVWFSDKVFSFWGEAVAAVAAGLLVGFFSMRNVGSN